jgi:hypothetical protein
MSIAGLVSRVERLERRAGLGAADDDYAMVFALQVIAHWQRGEWDEVEKWLVGKGKYLYQAFQVPRRPKHPLYRLLVNRTPHSWDLVPPAIQRVRLEEEQRRLEAILLGPARPWDPYGAAPLESYIQDDGATARCGYRVALTRERLDAAKADWEEKVRLSHEACREHGVEPIAWSGVVDWEWYYAHAVPPH